MRVCKKFCTAGWCFFTVYICMQITKINNIQVCKPLAVHKAVLKHFGDRNSNYTRFVESCRNVRWHVRTAQIVRLQPGNDLESLGIGKMVRSPLSTWLARDWRPDCLSVLYDPAGLTGWKELRIKQADERQVKQEVEVKAEPVRVEQQPVEVTMNPVDDEDERTVIDEEAAEIDEEMVARLTAAVNQQWDDDDDDDDLVESEGERQERLARHEDDDDVEKFMTDQLVRRLREARDACNAYMLTVPLFKRDQSMLDQVLHCTGVAFNAEQDNTDMQQVIEEAKKLERDVDVLEVMQRPERKRAIRMLKERVKVWDIAWDQARTRIIGVQGIMGLRYSKYRQYRDARKNGGGSSTDKY
jgi:hypothetical protein